MLVAVAATAIAAAGFALFFAREQRGETALGGKLYATHCAACHGVNLEGQPDWQTPKADGRLPAPPHDATGHTWHHSDVQLFEITKFGMSAVVPGHASDMPAFQGALNDHEIHAILAFIKSTWPANERRYQQLRSERAARDRR